MGEKNNYTEISSDKLTKSYTKQLYKKQIW